MKLEAQPINHWIEHRLSYSILASNYIIGGNLFLRAAANLLLKLRHGKGNDLLAGGAKEL